MIPWTEQISVIIIIITIRWRVQVSQSVAMKVADRSQDQLCVCVSMKLEGSAPCVFVIYKGEEIVQLSDGTRVFVSIGRPAGWLAD